MNQSRSHDELRELLGVYALDAVEPEEAIAVEEHLAECPRCRAEAESHRSVASLLGNVVSSAPPGLWDRIADSLDGAGPQPAAAPPATVLTFPEGGRPAAARRWWGRALVAGIAAVCLLVAGIAGVVSVRDHQGEDDDRTEQVASAAQDRAVAEALADPGSALVALTSPDDSTLVRAVVTPDGEGFVLGAPLPDAGDGRTYQLWGLDGSRAVSLGLLGRDPGVFEFRVEQPVSSLAVTSEVEGGVDQPTASPLVAGEIPA